MARPDRIRPEPGSVAPGACALRVTLERGAFGAPPDDTLGAIAYGAGPARIAGEGILDAGLATMDGEPALERWHAPGPAAPGREGAIRFAAHADFLFGMLELDEREHDGIAGAAEAAYRRIRDFHAGRAQCHLLRAWNFLDAINEGDGDFERYRRFCEGRARGLAGLPAGRLPAATAVGRRQPTGQLRVCWLAAREAGAPVENPRQIRAYRYPRRYGPSPPSFARAMRLGSGELMGSGTSSIVGHETVHAGDLRAQLDETLANLRALAQAGGATGAPAGVKVYLRRGAGSRGVEKRVQAGLPGAPRPLLIEADICRRELLVEIECLWLAAAIPPALC